MVLHLTCIHSCTSYNVHVATCSIASNIRSSRGWWWPWWLAGLVNRPGLRVRGRQAGVGCDPMAARGLAWFFAAAALHTQGCGTTPRVADSVAAGNLTFFTFYDFWLNSAYTAAPYNFNFSQAAAFINAPTVSLFSGVEIGFRAKQWKSLGGSQYIIWNVEETGIWNLPCVAQSSHGAYNA